MENERLIGTIAYLGGIMSLPEPFTFAWGNMLVFSHEALCKPGEHIHLDRAKLSLHDWARHEILARMQGDWILMLDTDIAFEPDLAARMVRTMYQYDVEVLTGAYCFKKPPHYPVLYLKNPDTGRLEIIADWDRSSELMQVESAGAGCLLVRRRVFERITSELGENPFERKGAKGEDHSFFERLSKLGIKAYCAWKIEVQHLDYIGLTPSRDTALSDEPVNEFVRHGFQQMPASAELQHMERT